MTHESTTAKWQIVLAAAPAICLILASAATAAGPSAVAALRLKPVQKSIQYDTPDAKQAEKCKLVAIKSKAAVGWQVNDPNGTTLRRFLDTNKDNKLDQWCYYLSGIEVYRDVDSNFNGKVDQIRWLGTAGTRWAIDRDEDGQVDAWKAISPEEVSAEVVAALANRDPARFRRVLLTGKELAELRLGKLQTGQLERKIAAAPAGFDTLQRKPPLASDAQWVNFGGTRPGMVPAGTDGSQRDLEVYENTVAMVETKKDVAQILIGTLVRVGNGWRVIDVPARLTDAQAGTAPDGFFFQAAMARRAGTDVPVSGGLSPELQKAVSDLEDVDRRLKEEKTAKGLAQLNAQRADVLERLAKLADSTEDYATWIRQLADTVSAAVQTGTYPDGVARLKLLVGRLESDKADGMLVAYVKYRFMTAEYGQSLQAADADYPKIQDRWLARLKTFVTDYPTSPDAADAMLQLAMAEEFAGHDDEAVKWYSRIAGEFGDATVARKATGAKRRIESIGKPLAFEGNDVKGNRVKLGDYRGKVVILHFWATWCEPCKQDISVLKDKRSKYGADHVAVIGVNVDNQRSELDQYLSENQLPWPQIFEEGGLDSRPALDLGILTLPTMLLLDGTGKVIRRNLRGAEVDQELSKLLR